MKLKFIFWSFLICLLNQSCREGGLQPTNCRSGKCTYSFEEGKKLLLDSVGVDQVFVRIENGDKLVFTYQYVENDQANIADDEYTEFIRFQVDPSVDSFSFEDEDLKNMPLYLSPVCFCPPEVSLPVRGEISGQKRDDGVWEVDVDVVFEIFDQEEERSFRSTFEQDE